ncbi:STAS/SEC14 domain-containing protein [Halomonas sp. V046]|uniref:SpoIIAA family protein n=1 Tax=Halomonas sp. V046 TaxID=3459611 RepID=UPI004044517C
MLELTHPPASHVVAMKASGTITANELQKAIDAIEAHKNKHPRINMVAELDDLRWMTFTALLRDIGYGLTQIGDIKRYHRAAVITDKEWIKHIAHLEDRLFKALEIRTFASKERAAAMAWVAEVPPGSEDGEPEQDGYHGA